MWEKRLEPAEGIPLLQKYETKLNSDKRFKLTEYKSSALAHFNIVFKFIKRRRLKKEGKQARSYFFFLNNLKIYSLHFSHYILDFYDLINKLKIQKEEIKNFIRKPGKKNSSLIERSIQFFRRSSQNDLSIRNQKKTFSGMFAHIEKSDNQ